MALSKIQPRRDDLAGIIVRSEKVEYCSHLVAVFRRQYLVEQTYEMASICLEVRVTREWRYIMFERVVADGISILLEDLRWT